MAALLLFAVVVVFNEGRPASPERHQRAFDRAQMESYEVLRNVDGRRMPPGLQSALITALGNRSAGLRFGEAVPVPTRNGRLWLVAGGGITCIVQEQGEALSCLASGAFVKKGLAVGMFKPPSQPDGRPTEFLVLGVAPDRAEKVRLKVAGTMRGISTHQNAYSYEADRPITVEGFEGG